ncbi:hypothetical protein CHS0354_034726 [Potamilus streckersoni]|nr:hypothetical protein CHS0354_034726 [Potamilus streckersoni]
MRFLRDLCDIKDILIVVFTPIILLPLPVLCPQSEAICAYAILIMAVYWLTEALPIAVTSLLPIFLFPVLGLMTAKEVSAKYINDASTLFIGGLIMAAAIEHWNIHKRIALKILMYVGSEPRWLMLGLMAPTWFLSMWISNTATTAMMIPIANAILVQIKRTEVDIKEVDGVDNQALDVKDIDLKTLPDNCKTTQNGDSHVDLHEKSSDFKEGEVRKEEDAAAKEMRQDPHYLRLCKALSLCIAYSANIGGIGSVTGSGANLVFKGQIDIEYQKHGLDSPITFTNWMAYCVPTSLILLVILWIWLQILFLRCRGCFGCRKGRKTKSNVKVIIQEEYRKLGPIDFAQTAVMVHFVVLVLLWITRDLGGILGWGNWFKKKYISDCVPAILISVLLFVVPTKIPRVFRCGVNGALPFCRSLLLQAHNLNVNPMYLMFPGAIATSFAFMLPVATPPNAVVFSYGYLRVIDMASAGFMMNIFCIPVLVLTTEIIGNAVYNFKELPAGFLVHTATTSMAFLVNTTTTAERFLVNTTTNITNP